MRGSAQSSGELFCYANLEEQARHDHPLRAIRDRGPEISFCRFWRVLFFYSGTGRPSIPLHRLLRAMLLQAFYGIRSPNQY
jgi:transposase